MLTIKELDEALIHHETFNKCYDKKCIDCLVYKDDKIQPKHVNIGIYLIKYKVSSKIFSICKKHANKHPIKDISTAITKLTEKDIFYLKIK